MESFNLPMEVKTEPIDEAFIKNEEPSEYEMPELVLVKSEHQEEKPTNENERQMKVLQIIQQQDVAERQDVDDHDVLNPQRYVINFGDPQVPHQVPNTDLSIFWKPFQQQQLENPNGTIYLTNREFGKYFLSNICQGHVQLNLTRGWNMYYVKEAFEVKLLLSEMFVKNGIPVMRRQIIINTFLQVSLFYGSREIKNIDVTKIKIRSANSIKELVASFSKWKQCAGLPTDIEWENWMSTIKYDNVMKIYRHENCQFIHQDLFEQCARCKYLQVRVAKVEKVRGRKYMTTTMLQNFKYWKKMRMRMIQLQKCNRTLQRDKASLKRKLRQLQRAKEKEKEKLKGVAVSNEIVSCNSNSSSNNVTTTVNDWVGVGSYYYIEGESVQIKEENGLEVVLIKEET